MYNMMTVVDNIVLYDWSSLRGGSQMFSSLCPQEKGNYIEDMLKWCFGLINKIGLIFHNAYVGQVICEVLFKYLTVFNYTSMKLKFKKNNSKKIKIIQILQKERSQRQFSPVIMLRHNYISVKVSMKHNLSLQGKERNCAGQPLYLKDTIKLLYLFKFRSHRPAFFRNRSREDVWVFLAD